MRQYGFLLTRNHRTRYQSCAVHKIGESVLKLKPWQGIFTLLVCAFLCAPTASFAAKKIKVPSAGSAVAPAIDDTVVSGTIKNIEITGNKKIEREAIVEKLSSKVGEALSSEKVHSDILALHKTNFFDSVQFDFDAGTLKVSVRERPSISKIVFFGNDQISTDDLKAVLTVKTFDLYDENQVRDTLRKLTKLYEDKGYFLAKISHEIRYNKERDMVELLFNVREYDKVRIKKITFLGNTAFGDMQLKRVMRGTSEGGFFSWLSNSGNFKELDFKTDLQILQYWYLNEGYVKFRYDTPIVTVSEDKKWVFITIRVHEGQKYKMATQDFAGDLLFPKQELHDMLTLREGDTFSISKRNADILALTEKYQDLGYANVNVVPQMDINDEKLTVATNYEFEKGTLVHFGRITVKGNSKTRDKVVRRELKIREGELYTGTGMRESKENVERLGFFEPGKIEFLTTSPPGRPDIMDVSIEVKERPTGQFQLGAGYATSTKFFFTTSVAETNFMGKGQDLRFQAQVSADRATRSFSLGFTDPYAWDSKWSAGSDVYYNSSVLPDRYNENRRGVSPRLGYPIGDYTRLYLGYKLEETRLTDVKDEVTKRNLDRENGTLSSTSATIQLDKRNNRMETTGGHFASWSEEFAGVLGGNRNFVRSIVDVRYYTKIWDDLVWRAKIEGGNVYDYKGLGIQSNERFYLGGPNNLRGYPSFRVGPISSDGQSRPEGALNELFTMWELEYPLVRDVGLKLVVFYDAGDAVNKFNQMNIKQDYGWGFRWFSPLGPLRFEWGFPVGHKTGVPNDGSVFQFMIGPPF